MNESAIFVIAAIGFLGVICQWVAWRVKLPAILFLLLTGILIGPVSGWLNPDRLFGNLLFPLVSIAVAVILFEGSLTLRLHEIKGLERVVRNLVSFGLVISGSVTAIASHWLIGLDWKLAALFGAMMTVTGPTVITPILRTVRPNAAVSKALRWEGIVIDPLGALLAVVIYEFIISSQGTSAVGHLVGTFSLILFVGGVTGLIAGHVLGLLLRHYLIPEYLHNVATLSAVVAVFAGATRLAPESGLLAVTVMGMWLANMKRIPVAAILDFKESLSMFFISGLFIILAARLNLQQMLQIGWGAIGVLVVLQFLARPLKVWLSTVNSPLNARERMLLAWIGPRGIIAAAVSALFAHRLSALGYEDAKRLVPLTFLVIIGTVIVQSLTARPLARILHIAEPEPRGLLLVGANPVARAIGRALKKRGFQVILADSYWEHIKSARMDGLNTYYGNPVSEHSDRHLDLIGIGRLLGLSPQGDLNILTAQYYRREFGQQNVYTLPTSFENESQRKKHTVSAEFRGRPLFGEDSSYRKLQSWISQGADIRATTLTESFKLENWSQNYRGRALPLFAITPKGELRIFTSDSETRPGPDWTILALTLPEPKNGEAKTPNPQTA